MQERKCAYCHQTGTKKCSVCDEPYCGAICQLRDWPEHKKLCGGKLEHSLDPVVWKWFQPHNLTLAEIREYTTVELIHGMPMNRETVDWLNTLEARLTEKEFVPNPHAIRRHSVGINTLLGSKIRASIIPIYVHSRDFNPNYCEVMFINMDMDKRKKFNINDEGIRYFKTIDELMNTLCEIRGRQTTLIKPARATSKR